MHDVRHHERSVLGPADVADEQLEAMVADLLGSDPAATRVLTSTAVPVDYDLAAITTAGRWWVRGTALVGDDERPFAMFVKHVQSWSRSPLFRFVPPEHQEMAAASVPWQTEPLAYRSDLGDRLPPGLRMPRAVGVFDLDELSASVWLEVVDVRPVAWDLDRYAEAARLMGRVAGSGRIRELATVGRHDFQVRDYLHGRLGMQVIPLLRSEEVAAHPLVADHFGDGLRERMLEVADRAADLVEELETFPRTTSHGDACPNNLLCPVDSEDLVLIDYGFWGLQPVGFDLAQLLVGDVQVGRRTGEDLAEVDAVITTAYVEGLRAEGCDLPADAVRRAHALQLMVFTGLSAMPFEHLDAAPTPELHRVAAERARIARFSLDLLEETAS